jgi:four helix bundle protein
MANYEKLNIRQNAVELSVDIYKFMNNNSDIKKDFALKDQIQRSSVSIASNIAEGADRGTQKEFNRFLYIARGSCSELRTQMLIIQKL